MYIIDLIPLAFIPRNQAQILSYFHNHILERGSVVEVEIGHRKVTGIVISSDPIKSRKLIFKKSVDFKLKNISEIIDPLPKVFDWQFYMSEAMSSHYYAPLGICLKTILPPFFTKKYYKPEKETATIDPVAKNVDSSFIISDFQNSILKYEKEIKKTISAGQQVFLMVAENTVAEYLRKDLANLNPTLISSETKDKEYHEFWREISRGNIKLVIGTRVGLFLPFSDLGLIIVDDESNDFYKSDMSPRYNAADFAHEIAKIHSAKIIFSSSVPRLETLKSLQPELTNTKNQNTKTISMFSEVKAGNFSIFSRDLKEQLLKNISEEKNSIIYIPRRGHSNLILCQSCSNTIKCPNCSTSLVPHSQINPNNHQEINLSCHRCGHKETQPKQCPYCKSYKIKATGVGIQKVIEELKKIPNSRQFKTLQLDSDTSENKNKKEVEILEEFKVNRPSILVTTQIIFSHAKSLPKTPLIGIINADALINIPDFRAEESLFRQIYTLGTMTERLIIQTHNPDDQAIKFAAQGDLSGFLSRELEHREDFNYPPFSQLVKLTFKHPNPIKARNETNILSSKFRAILSQNKNIEIDMIGPSSGFISRERGQNIWNIVLKIKNPGENRNELLKYVPNGWTVDVDPRNII